MREMKEYNHVLVDTKKFRSMDLLHDETKRTHWGDKTVEQMVKDWELDQWEVMTWDEFTKRTYKKLCKPWVETDKETFWEMLEVLPPERWRNMGNAEFFQISEKETLDITATYARVGDRYFYAKRRTSCDYSEELKAIEEIM